MAAQAGLCLAWSETSEDTFCRVAAHIVLQACERYDLKTSTKKTEVVKRSTTEKLYNGRTNNVSGVKFTDLGSTFKLSSAMRIGDEVNIRNAKPVQHVIYVYKIFNELSENRWHEPRHEKTCFSHMQTTKVQIRLHIRAVWSATLLFAA